MPVAAHGSDPTPATWPQRHRQTTSRGRVEPASKSISASSCALFTGSAFRRIAFTSWKMAVFAPIPRASERIAMAAKPGLDFNWRIP